MAIGTGQGQAYPIGGGLNNDNRVGVGLPSISRQTTRDVGITGITSASYSVYRGEIVTVEVTVQNLGNARESFPLELRDSSDDSTLAEVRMTLDPQQVFSIGLTWDTANSAPQAHTLYAVTTLAGDQNSGNDSRTLDWSITVIQRDIQLGDEIGFNVPDAFFGGNLLRPEISTTVIQRDIRLGDDLDIEVPDASFGGNLLRPEISTPPSRSIDLFVGGADAEYWGTLTLAHIETLGMPGHGLIIGVVHLEGRKSSLGGFLAVGDEIHHVEASGAYTIEAPSDAVDILVAAPGYVPVSIPQAQVEIGDTLVLPELTLRFGDGNGDGVIDILDLSMAADNFGDTIKEVTVP